MADRLQFQVNPLAGLPLDGIRMITMHDACLSVVTAGGTYRYQFENSNDLRKAFSEWCDLVSQNETSDQHDGLNIAILRH